MTTDPSHVPGCPMCRIASGEFTAHVLHRTDRIMAFLDIHPIRPAHVLVIPLAHHHYFDRLPVDVANEILAFGQRLAPLLRRHAGVERVAFMFSGIDLPHAHAHVFPMHETSDITSRRAIVEPQVTIRRMPRVSDDALGATAEALRALLASV